MKHKHWTDVYDNHKKLWIGGSNPDSVIKMFGLTGLLSKHRLSVMDVGVGYGDMAKRLNGLGHIVTCVDIVQGALDNAKEWSHRGILFDDLMDEDPVLADIAICNLVAQHCDDESLKKLIKGILFHMSDVGELYLQSAGINRGKYKKYRSTTDLMATGLLILRTKKELSSIVKECGGFIEFLDNTLTFEKRWGIDWYFARIRRTLYDQEKEAF